MIPTRTELLCLGAEIWWGRDIESRHLCGLNFLPSSKYSQVKMRGYYKEWMDDRPIEFSNKTRWIFSALMTQTMGFARSWHDCQDDTHGGLGTRHILTRFFVICEVLCILDVTKSHSPALLANHPNCWLSPCNPPGPSSSAPEGSVAAVAGAV